MRNGYLTAPAARLDGLATIYALFDAEEMIYVGSCASLAHVRWIEHCQLKSETAITQRLRRMKNAGRVPAVRVLERVPSKDRWKRERWWISWADRNGGFLENRVG